MPKRAVGTACASGARAIFGKAHDASATAFAPQVAASTDVSWSCLVEELPIAWPEARHRLGTHPASV